MRMRERGRFELRGFERMEAASSGIRQNGAVVVIFKKERKENESQELRNWCVVCRCDNVMLLLLIVLSSLIVTQLVKSKSPNWAALESRIQAAFHARDITVAVHRRDVKKDGTWSQMQLILGQDTQSESTDQQQTQTQSQWQASAAAAASSSSSAAPTTSPPIHLSLRRVSDEGSPSHALLLVSYLCADLMRSNTLLESSLTLKQSKLQHARRLAGIAPGSGGPREMAYAASLGLGPGGGSQSVSLVNPGRIKRKRVDDEGFEEDSEEEKASIKGDAAVAGSPSDGKRPEGGSQTEEE